jgi:hypothetical protein
VVEGETMSDRDIKWQEQRLDEIMYSSASPEEKVRAIMRLGFDEEIATELVERHIMGSRAPLMSSQIPAYYETLAFDAEYEESFSEHQRREDLEDEQKTP